MSIPNRLVVRNPRPTACQATLLLARIEVPAHGGEFVVPANLEPPGCPVPIALNAPWLTIADVAGRRFRAEPNSGAGRDAVISFGGPSFYVRQSPPPQAGVAAAPSRVVFGVDKRGRTDAQTLTAWGEGSSGRFTARPGHPWLAVRPGKGKQQDRQAFEVTVRPDARLGPGRHDSFIQLAPSEAPGALLEIPIVVEVISTR